MRWILLSLFFLPMMACPSWAAKRLTIAQLEQMLGTERAARKSDIEIARKISEIELSERLTDLALAQLNKQFASGSQPAMALLLLADRSAFLDPPANELPSTPTPDAATQQQLLEAAKRYAVQSLPNLPNLLATRTTFNFDDSPQEVTKGGYLQRIGLHLVGTSKTEVSVRNEKENLSTRAKTATSPAQGGLMTWGEFGSTLLVVLSDSSQGKTSWSHWEQTSSGLMAVFHYQVPKAASHYEIDTPVERIQHNGGSNRWAYAGGMAAMTTTAMVRNKPGYQGSLWIDPATGTILRVTLVADLKGNSTIERGAILVEYGPVTIAGKSLICPVRSLALSSAPATVDTNFEGVATEWLNENLFTNYHMFASTSRILNEQAAASALSPTQDTTSALNDQVSPVDGHRSPPESAPAVPVSQKAAIPSVDLPSSAPAAPVEKAETSEPATQTNATGLVPEAPPAASPLPAAPSTATSTASQPPPPSNTPVSPTSEAETQFSAPAIELNVSRVLVPVVVRDKQGHIVGNLKKEDFRVFDEGKPRPVSAFNVERRGPVGSQAAIGAESDQQSPTQGNAAAQPSVLPERITVLLFDDLHLTFEDMTYVKKAASNALDATLRGSDVAAVVSISGKINSGLTRDRARLQDAIMSIQPQGIYRTDTADCPKVDYYQADLIENKRDAAALKDVVNQIMYVCDPKTPEDMAERLADSAAMHSLSVGRQDVLITYATLKEVLRRMATLPGQRSLLLISDGFLPIEQEARYAESQVMDLAVQSNVSINAIDARGLYIGSITASDDTRKRSPGQIEEYRRSSMRMAEQSMGELADGTGGIFFHNNNDLRAGFKAITEAPEVVYMLELPLDGVKANGSYHRLEVKVDREGLEVQARRGYFIPKPEKPKKAGPS
ncbi:MAG: VWA domain-containing protein [Terracidiphilus sp.]